MAHVVMVVEATIAEVIAKAHVKVLVRVNVEVVLVAKERVREVVNMVAPLKTNSNRNRKIVVR